MARRALTRDMYEQLLECFRSFPSEYSKAAKAAGVDYRTARRAWETGYPNQRAREWNRPMRDVIAEEQVAARAKIEEQTRAKVAADARAAGLPPIDAEAARTDAVKRMAEDGLLVRDVNAGGRALFRVLATMFPAMVELATGVVTDVKAGKFKGHPGDAIHALGKFTNAVARVSEVAERAQVMDYRRLGKPTDILGVQETLHEEMGLEDFERELQAATHAVAKAKELGLVKMAEVAGREGVFEAADVPVPPAPPAAQRH